MPPWSRRRTLRSIGAVSIGSVAGCSAFSKEMQKQTRWSSERVKWAAPLNGSPTGLSLDTNRLYSANSWGVYAVNPESGEQQWHTELDPPGDTVSYPGFVDVGGDRVYTKSFNEVLAIDANTGTRRWTTKMDSGEPKLRATAGNVYASTETVSAINASTGNTTWTSPTAQYQFSRPTLVNETVYVGTKGGFVSALDSQDGHEYWQSELGSIRVVEPTVVDGTVYVGGSTTSSGVLAAVDAEDGVIKWRVSTEPVGLGQAPAVSEDAVFVGCFGEDQGHLVAHERADGTHRWSFNPPGSWLVGQPVATDGVVYVGTSEGIIYAIDAVSGETQWEFDAGGIAYTKPIVHDSLVYVAGRDHVAALHTGSTQ